MRCGSTGAAEERLKKHVVNFSQEGNKITVTLNGKKIHDGVVCDKPTGGEVDNKVKEPGPILLQGDHGKVRFRNIVLTPGK